MNDLSFEKYLRNNLETENLQIKNEQNIVFKKKFKFKRMNYFFSVTGREQQFCNVIASANKSWEEKFHNEFVKGKSC